jgi:Fur family zinc uptake transcriptional regulator
VTHFSIGPKHREGCNNGVYASLGRDMSAIAANKPDKSLNDTEHQVVRHLQRTTKLLSAYDIQNALRIRYPNTVYRALERLSRLGLVHRIESKNAFIACADSTRSHSPGFIVCTECGAVQEFRVEALMPVLQSEAADRQFTIEKTTIELIGRCSKCTRRQTKDRPTPVEG